MGAAEVVANTLRRSLRAPFLVEGIEIYISASVGISLYPSDADDAETLLKHADVAMYSVKDAGRDGHALYNHGADTALEQISMAACARRSSAGRALSCTISRSSTSIPRRSSVSRLSKPSGRVSRANGMKT